MPSHIFRVVVLLTTCWNGNSLLFGDLESEEGCIAQVILVWFWIRFQIRVWSMECNLESCFNHLSPGQCVAFLSIRHLPVQKNIWTHPSIIRHQYEQVRRTVFQGGHPELILPWTRFSTVMLHTTFDPVLWVHITSLPWSLSRNEQRAPRALGKLNFHFNLGIF